MIQSVDNERYGKNLQASFKQNFIREEKNRGEKKNNNNKEKEIIAVAAVDKLPRFSELSETIPRWNNASMKLSLPRVGWRLWDDVRFEGTLFEQSFFYS